MIRSRRWAMPLALLLSAACSGQEAADGEAPVPPAGGAPAADAPDLRRLGFVRGREGAPVTVVEFSDFGCPYCAQFALQSYPELHRDFVETGQVSWRFVPFVLGSFPNGDLAARASECAGEQDRFWEMHDRLFERQRDWKRTDDADALFASIAAELGLDAARFDECWDSGRTEQRTTLANGVATELGVRATPTFFINGQRIEGALPPDHFRTLLDWAGAGGGPEAR